MGRDISQQWHAFFPDTKPINQWVNAMNNTTYCNVSVARDKKSNAPLIREKRLILEVQTTWQKLEDIFQAQANILGNVRLQIMPWSPDPPYWTECELHIGEGISFAEALRRTRLSIANFCAGLRIPQIRERMRELPYGLLNVKAVPNVLYQISELQKKSEALGILLHEAEGMPDKPDNASRAS